MIGWRPLSLRIRAVLVMALNISEIESWPILLPPAAIKAKFWLGLEEVAGRGIVATDFAILVIEVGVSSLEILKFDGKLLLGHLLMWEDPTMIMLTVSSAMI